MFMFRHVPRAKSSRRVWRITERTPMGEWFDPDTIAVPSPKEDLPEVFTGGWIVSSYDLLNGSEISDGPDTVPDDLFDELFRPNNDAHKATSK